VELSLFSQALTQLLYILTKALNLLTTNADDFYFWLDRFLFKEEKQKATLKRIEEAFGYQSNVFIESYRELSIWFQEAKKFGEVQVSFEQWKKFLSIAYGSCVKLNTSKFVAAEGIGRFYLVQQRTQWRAKDHVNGIKKMQ
jgi:hypothetical protein